MVCRSRYPRLLLTDGALCRWNEAARRYCARHGDGAGYSFDGRAVYRARRTDAPEDAGRIDVAVGRHPITVVFVTHSIPEAIKFGTRILLLSPHPGQAKAELNGGVKGEDALELEKRIQTMLFADTIEEAENV